MAGNTYIRFWITIIGLVFLTVALHYLQDLLVPMLFAAFFSMLMLPVCSLLEKKIPRGFAVMICVFLIIGFIAGLLILLYTQISILIADLPQFKAKAIELIHGVQSAIQSRFHVSTEEQTRWLEANSSRATGIAGDVAKSFLLSVTGGFAHFILIIIYFIFFLLLRGRLRNFLLDIFDQQHHDSVAIVLSRTQRLTRQYMIGLLTVIAILGTANAIGFLILGLKQAIFLGFLRGLFSIIPYVGPVIGTIFPVFSALVYQDAGTVLGVVIVSLGSQFIEHNFLTPRIVGSHIKINPLATIMVILMGEMLWGLSGMILFLPMLGIAKIVCDNVDVLKPLGYLMGEDAKEEKK